MIYKYKHDDVFRFLGGFNQRELFWYNKRNNLIDITDFEFKDEIKKLNFNRQYHSKMTSDGSSVLKTTYCYVLHDDVVKVIYFGRKIQEKIKEQLEKSDISDFDFNVRIVNHSGFPDYDSSFFTKSEIKIDRDYLKTTQFDKIEDFIKPLEWKRNIMDIIEYLENSDTDISRKLSRYTRSRKINKIFKNERTLQQN